MNSFSNSIRLSVFWMILCMIEPMWVSGQHQAGGVPLSFGRALSAAKLIPFDIPAPSSAVILENEKNISLPYRFAISIPVDINIENSGSADWLPDGQRVWRLALRSSGAKALILYFNRFSIPAGGKLFIYNPSRSQMYGAFTSTNNNSFNTFACPMIEGEALVLEYDSPRDLPAPDIHISEVAYAFRGSPAFEENNPLPSSGNCEVNVNCSEGDNWQRQKRGVVKIIVKDSSGNSRLCSGSMINNTNNNGIPYLLTADHCGRYSRAIDMSQWLFYFNYEMPDCSNTTPHKANILLGAVMKSHGGTETTGSDFYLVKLSEKIPDSLHVYFNGWSNEDIPSPNGTGIHHPAGDVKKISTYTTPLVTAHWSGNPNACHWQVIWAETTHGHGVTEGGSSGSPLFSSEGLIVGTLTGGDSFCDIGSLNLPDYYGKFSWHWDKNGSDSTAVLKYWLDPQNTGVTKLNGWALGINDQALNTDITLSPNPAHEVAFLNIDSKSGPDEILSIGLFDILGKPCPASLITKAAPGRYIFDLQSVTPGMYVVLIHGRDFRKSLKLLKM